MSPSPPPSATPRHPLDNRPEKETLIEFCRKGGSLPFALHQLPSSVTASLTEPEAKPQIMLCIPFQLFYDFNLGSLHKILVELFALNNNVAVGCEPYMGRYRAFILQPSTIQGVPPKILTTFIADYEGESVFKAMLRYLAEEENKSAERGIILENKS